MKHEFTNDEPQLREGHTIDQWMAIAKSYRRDAELMMESRDKACLKIKMMRGAMISIRKGEPINIDEQELHELDDFVRSLRNDPENEPIGTEAEIEAKETVLNEISRTH